MTGNAIFDRRSIRKYQTEMPSAEQVEQILLAGRAAPSGKNHQPWKFYVYKGEKKDDFLAAMQIGLLRRKTEAGSNTPLWRAGLADAVNTLRIMCTAPILIAVVYPEGTDLLQDVKLDIHIGEIIDVLSIDAAFQNMLLEAHRQDLGSLWIANIFLHIRN